MLGFFGPRLIKDLLNGWSESERLCCSNKGISYVVVYGYSEYSA
jgi:hypothetical protein